MGFPHTLHCRCGVEVLFTDEDRGGDVYCPSCGAALTCPVAATAAAPDANRGLGAVPGTETAGSSAIAQQPLDSTSAITVRLAQAQPSSRGSVFSSEGLYALQRRVVREVECLCGRKIPVCLEEFGESVYCPSCGSEVQAGERLTARSAPNFSGSESPASTSDRHDAARPSRFRVSPPIALVLALGCAIVSGAILVWRQREEIVATFPIRLSWQMAPAPMGGGEQFDPNAVTEESILALLENPDPFQALGLVQGWKRGLLAHAVPVDDPRFDHLDDVSRRLLDESRTAMLALIDGLPSSDDAERALRQALEWQKTLVGASLSQNEVRREHLVQAIAALEERTNPITLEQIKALHEAEDVSEALVLARLLQSSLDRRQIEARDPRRTRLSKLIEEFSRRLAPPAATNLPEFETDLQKAIVEISEALKSSRWQDALKSLEQAETLLQDHPEELTAYKPRVMALRQALSSRQSIQSGVELIESLLKSADAAARNGDVTVALEKHARARFLSMLTPMTAKDGDRLQALADDVSGQLRFARGKRAVEDARSCEEANDRPGRNREVRRAFHLLPGLPEVRIRPYLSQVKEWERDAAGESPDSSSSSAASEIDARDAYEKALDAVARGNIDGFVDVCIQAREAHSGNAVWLKVWEVRLQSVYFETLETFLDRIQGSSNRQEQPLKIIPSRDEIRRQLERTSFWKNSDRWKSAFEITRKPETESEGSN